MCTRSVSIFSHQPDILAFNITLMTTIFIQSQCSQGRIHPPRDPSIFWNKIFLRGVTIIMLVAAASCVSCRLCLRYFDFKDQIIFLRKVHICILLYDLIYEDTKKVAFSSSCGGLQPSAPPNGPFRPIQRPCGR